MVIWDRFAKALHFAFVLWMSYYAFRGFMADAYYWPIPVILFLAGLPRFSREDV